MAWGLGGEVRVRVGSGGLGFGLGAWGWAHTTRKRLPARLCENPWYFGDLVCVWSAGGLQQLGCNSPRKGIMSEPARMAKSV